MIYLDTSFVMSLYSSDVNTRMAIAQFPKMPVVRLLSPLVEIEVVNAFELRVFRREISRGEAELGMRNFDHDLEAGILASRSLPDDLFARATVLSMKHTAQLGVRTMDVLHVAAAIEYGATSLFSFDLRQREVAHAAGLKLNPMPKRPRPAAQPGTAP